jgi:hypothetical protein
VLVVLVLATVVLLVHRFHAPVPEAAHLAATAAAVDPAAAAAATTATSVTRVQPPPLSPSPPSSSAAAPVHPASTTTAEAQPPPPTPPPVPSSSSSSSSSWYELNPFQTCSVRNASVAEILASDPLLSDPRSVINPLAFKLMADAYFGKGAIPDGYGEVLNRKRLEYVVTCLQPGAVVFVVTRSLRQFFDRYYDRIAVPFVLVSGDSDLNVPKSVLDVETVARVLHGDKSKVIFWYAMNCDSNPAPAKFRCLPNGISQWNGQIETMKQLFAEGVGVAQYVAAAAGNSDHSSTKQQSPATASKKQHQHQHHHQQGQPLKNDSYSILVSFSVDSNREVRQPAWEYLCPNAPNNHLLPLSVSTGSAAAAIKAAVVATAVTAGNTTAASLATKRFVLIANATTPAHVRERVPDKPYAHCSFLRPISQHEFYHQVRLRVPSPPVHGWGTEN